MKNSLLLIALICSSASLFAQDFALTYESDAIFETIIVRDVSKTSDGDLLAGYDLLSAGQPPTAGIMKTDGNGEVLWSKKLEIAASAAGCAFEVVENAEGNFYLWGLSKEAETDNMRAILSEISMDGEMLWSKEYDFGYNFTAAYTVNKLSVLPSGDLQMMISVYGKVIVMKTNASGEIIWGTYSSIGPPDEGGKNPGFEWLAIPDDGGLCASKAGNDFSLLRYNNTGEIIWNQTYQIGGYTHGKTIARSPNGNILIAGFIDYVPHIMEISDEDGSIVWIKVFEELTLPFAGKAHLSILGETIIFDFTTELNDQYIVSLNADGEVLKTMKAIYAVFDYNKIEIINETESYFYGAAALIGGLEGMIQRTTSVLEESCMIIEVENLIATEYTYYSAVEFEPFTMDFTSEDDIEITLVDVPLRTNIACELDQSGIDSDEMNEISVYPNPASNSITLNVANNMVNATYTVTSLSGKQVMTDRIIATQMQIDLSTLTHGQYILAIQTETELITKKITLLK
ncbi:MAG: T9SS type A sorting domain-containing protein [Crocinitomix sp.]|nr:T9SS type A sorting domain-containing protein [Crocinitomix sp.]